MEVGYLDIDGYFILQFIIQFNQFNFTCIKFAACGHGLSHILPFTLIYFDLLFP